MHCNNQYLLRTKVIFLSIRADFGALPQRPAFFMECGIRSYPVFPGVRRQMPG